MCMQLETFTKVVVLSSGKPTPGTCELASFWHNIASWWPVRHEPRVCWLHYEDIVAVRPSCPCQSRRLPPAS